MSFRESSEELASKTVSAINCNGYLMQYKNCLDAADGKKSKLKECGKMMNEFRFCLAEKSMERAQQQSKQ